MLKQQLSDDLKAAMLAGDKPLVGILRDLKSAILSKEVAENKRDQGLEDNEIVAVLKKEQKSRKESLDVYQKAGEQERANIEKYQLEVIEKYLPEEMSEDDVKKLVDEVVSSLEGDISMKDMGRIIGVVKAKADNIDGALLAQIVKDRITA